MLFNDEIISISEVGPRETVDITVDKDNLFYCNGIITHNSFGVPATADFMFALINTEELEEMNQLLVKVLKNRYGGLHKRNKTTGKSMNKFVVGIDRDKQRLYNVDESAQKDVSDNVPELKQIEDIVAKSEKDSAVWETDEPKFDIDQTPEPSQQDVKKPPVSQFRQKQDSALKRAVKHEITG